MIFYERRNLNQLSNFSWWTLLSISRQMKIFYEHHRQIQEKEKPQHLVVEGNWSKLKNSLISLQTRNCDWWRIFTVSWAFKNLWYLISVLSIVPPHKRPKPLLKRWPNLTLQAEIIGCGIIDKTMMCEAVVLSGMKYAIWVKYRLPTFHNNYNNKYCIAWIKNKEENPEIQGQYFKKISKKKNQTFYSMPLQYCELATAKRFRSPYSICSF